MPLGTLLPRYKTVIPLVALASALIARAGIGDDAGGRTQAIGDRANLERPPRTPIYSRTPTSTPTSTRTPTILKYVLQPDSHFDLYYGTRPPSLSGPLTGSLELVERGAITNQGAEFSIRKLELRGAHYEFTGRGGRLTLERRNRRVTTTIDVLLHIEPSPVGGDDAIDVQFTGGTSWRRSRFPPSFRGVTLVGPRRPPPFSFHLRIFAEPE